MQSPYCINDEVGNAMMDETEEIIGRPLIPNPIPSVILVFGMAEQRIVLSVWRRQSVAMAAVLNAAPLFGAGWAFCRK